MWNYLSTYWNSTHNITYDLKNSRLFTEGFSNSTPINSESASAPLLSLRHDIHFLLTNLLDNNSRSNGVESSKTATAIHRELIPLAQLLMNAFTQHLQLFIHIIDHQMLSSMEVNHSCHHKYLHPDQHNHTVDPCDDHHDHHHRILVTTVTRAYMKFLESAQSMTR